MSTILTTVLCDFLQTHNSIYRIEHLTTLLQRIQKGEGCQEMFLSDYLDVTNNIGEPYFDVIVVPLLEESLRRHPEFVSLYEKAKKIKKMLNE